MTIHKDETGHWIGEDGFVCPLDFQEFHQWYPDYGVMMARHLRRGADPDVIDDLAQDIWCKLVSTRVVERFDPVRMHGCNERRFHYYLKLVLTRMNHTRWAVSMKEPLTDSDTMDADAEMGLTEEHVHHMRLHQVATTNIDDQIYMQEFRAYVAEHRPALVRVIDALLSNNNHKEAAEELGFRPRQMSYQLVRLQRLAKQFTQQPAWQDTGTTAK